jgi:hypothetical protein
MTGGTHFAYHCEDIKRQEGNDGTFNCEFYYFSEFIKGFFQSRSFGENDADTEHE